MEVKANINKWDLIKFKSFCTEKEIGNHKQNKNQPTEWEKIFANNVTNKGLISSIHKQLIQFSNNKISQLKSEQKT